MDAKQEKERIDVPPSEWEVSELLDILNGTGSAAFVLTLRRLAFQRDRLAAEVAELRRVLREYQDQRDLGFIEFLTDSSEQMNREIDAAMSPKV